MFKVGGIGRIAPLVDIRDVDVDIKTPNGRVKLTIEGELRGADLSGQNLSGVDGLDNLGGETQLQAADLRETNWTGAIFAAAEYDHETLLPKNFRPQTQRMKLVVPKDRK